MLDTVKLYINDYQVKDNANLRLQPAALDYKSGEAVGEYALWSRERGEAVFGAKAYLNTDFFNFTIQPIGRGERRSPGAFLQFSIPKVHNGENYYSVGREGSQAVFKKVEKELWNKGIHTNIEEATLSRVDLFRNVIAEERFYSYSPLFQLLKAKRQKRRDYGTTFLWHNTQQQLCVYDKLEEMEMRGKLTGSLPANTIRFEYRLMNSRKVDTILGFKKLGELKKNYEALEPAYKASLKKSIFSLSVEHVQVMTGKQVEEEMRIYKERYGLRWLNAYLSSVGARELVKLAGIEVVRGAIENITSDRVKVWRLMKKLEERQRELELIREEEVSGKTLSDLYCELEKKALLN